MPNTTINKYLSPSTYSILNPHDWLGEFPGKEPDENRLLASTCLAELEMVIHPNRATQRLFSAEVIDRDAEVGCGVILQVELGDLRNG